MSIPRELLLSLGSYLQRGTFATLELGFFLRWGDVEVAPGYGDFLRGLEDLKAQPLKEQRQRLKNEVFGVSTATPLILS